MVDCVLKTYALYCKKNFIATDKGCRSKRKRDYDKMIFEDYYILLNHSEGKFKQKWFAGNESRISSDRMFARIRGPKCFYINSTVERLAYYVVHATCKLLASHYDDEITIKEVENRLKQTIYATSKNLKLNLDEEFYNVMFNALMEFIRIGWKNYLNGGSFGRKSGRPRVSKYQS